MASTIHQQGSFFGLMTSTDEGSPSISQFSKQSLWMLGCCSPPGIDEELKGSAFALSIGSLSQTTVKGFASAAVPGDAAAFVSLLRACAKDKDLCRGTQVHDDIAKKGLLQKCSNALVTMYAKCGELGKARDLLDMHKSRDVTAWTALIAGYAREGQSRDALDCFECMQRNGIRPDAVTYTCILKACAAVGAVEKGKEIHEDLVNQGLLQDNILLGTALVDMYAKCGALSKAEDVLDMLPFHDPVSWNALIAGYAKNGLGEQALKCFDRMQSEGICPNRVTYAFILKACAIVGAKGRAKKIHDEIVRQGLLYNDLMLSTTLIDMYVKWGALSKAQDVLENLCFRDVVAWNALIGGCTQAGEGEQALIFFERMQEEGIPPNTVTYACILKACATTGDTKKGKQFHLEIVRQGLLQDNILLGNALVDMYAKWGDLSKAQGILENLPSQDVVSWSTLISGYVQRGQGEQALSCLERMKDEGISPNEVTYVCILKACAIIGALDKGKQIHEEIVRNGILKDNIVLENALVDMYAKCGALSKAQGVLEKLSFGDVVAWSTLIAGYVQEGQGDQALNCFKHMKQKGILPDAATYACILKACAIIGAVDKGKELHDEVLKQGLLKDNIMLGNALIDMYAKCGALSKAQAVLEQLPSRDIVSWNVMISGYAQKGEGEQALNCFERMQCEYVQPNAVTFVCVLNVCSHLGLVEEGYKLFVNMRRNYGVNPNLECYTCVVDLLGRAGHLEKVVQLMQDIPSFDCSAIWLAILGACQKWGDVNVGRWAFEQAVQVDKSGGPAYVLMANIYAAAGMQRNARIIEAM